MPDVCCTVDDSRAKVFVCTDDEELRGLAERVEDLSLVQDQIGRRALDSEESLDGLLEHFDSNTEFGRDGISRRFPV
jgi:hypothetical protein